MAQVTGFWPPVKIRIMFLGPDTGPDQYQLLWLGFGSWIRTSLFSSKLQISKNYCRPQSEGNFYVFVLILQLKEEAIAFLSFYILLSYAAFFFHHNFWLLIKVRILICFMPQYISSHYTNNNNTWMLRKTNSSLCFSIVWYIAKSFIKLHRAFLISYHPIIV